MGDFSKVTLCIRCISETLIDEWLEQCKKSILRNEKPQISGAETFQYRKFCNMLKQDNPKMCQEFIKKKDIINVDYITPKVEHDDIDNYHDEQGYLKELPADKHFMTVISTMTSVLQRSN